MSKCIIVETKYGPMRVQISGGKPLPKSDIEQLEKFVEYIKDKRKSKEVKNER